MTHGRDAGRWVTYVSWNLAAVGALGALALVGVADARVGNHRDLLLFALGGLILAALVWGVRERHRRSSWLLPRAYVVIAAPVGVAFLVSGDWTPFWIGVVWLVFVPLFLSDGSVDRWLGVPARIQREDRRHDVRGRYT